MSYGGLICEFCNGQHPVIMLVTNLSSGDTLTICAEDVSVALVPLLAGNLGVDPQRFYDAVKRFVDREAAREAKAAQEVEAAIDATALEDERLGGDTEGQAGDSNQADEDEETGLFHGTDEEAL